MILTDIFDSKYSYLSVGNLLVIFDRHLIGFFLFLALTIYTAMKVPTVVDLHSLQVIALQLNTCFFVSSQFLFIEEADCKLISCDRWLISLFPSVSIISSFKIDRQIRLLKNGSMHWFTFMRCVYHLRCN